LESKIDAVRERLNALKSGIIEGCKNTVKHKLYFEKEALPPGGEKPSLPARAGNLMCVAEPFDKLPDGDEVTLYRIAGGKRITVEILSFGGIIHRLLAPDKAGNIADVVLGQDSIAIYQHQSLGACAGAVIGRVANRISKACFEIGDNIYKLDANFGGDVIHGSTGIYATKNFTGKPYSNEDSAGVVLSLTDTGEGGFPGKVDVTVTYSLDNYGNFRIHYTALLEMDTPINLTNHVYFNLVGHGTGEVGGHVMQLNADFITPNDARGMTTGEIRNVKGTDFDYTLPKPLQTGFDSEDPLFTQFGGFDMNFCIRGRGMRRGGSIMDPISGRVMEFFTDQPGVQVYTMPNLADNVYGKGGVHYVKLGAVCLETQIYPDCVNISHFPNPFVSAGTKYETDTIYRFSVI